VPALLHFDERLFVLLNQVWTAPFLDKWMPILTDFDHWRIPVIGAVLIALVKGSRDVRIAMLLAVVAVASADQIAVNVIKPRFERIRPSEALAGTRQLVDAHDSSFPSAHAANTFAAGTFLAVRFPRMIPILVIPAVVSYSRVYVGVHYPLDVLAGGALGATIGGVLAALERALRSRWGKRR
jgi:undecaprenyl-diphosphatase